MGIREYSLKTQAKYYEFIAKNLTGKKQLKALRKAQNCLMPHELDYLKDFQRIQEKIILNMEKS